MKTKQFSTWKAMTSDRYLQIRLSRSQRKVNFIDDDTAVMATASVKADD